MEYVQSHNEYKDPARAKRIIKELHRQLASMTEEQQIQDLLEFRRDAAKAEDSDAEKIARDELSKRDIAVFTSSHGPMHHYPGKINDWEMDI